MSYSGRSHGGKLALDETTSNTPHKYHETIDALRDDVTRRQRAHIREQRDAQTKIQTLQQEIDKTTRMHSVTEQLAEERMGQLRSVQDTILRNIEHVQEQTSRILQEQERDLLRAFRARLFDVQTELEKERARAEDGAAVWIEKNRQLEKELEWAKDMADRLDRHNQALAGENSRIKTQFKTQQDDREYLIRQLVAAKKDNVRLRQDNDRLQEENDRLVTEVEQRKADMAGMMSSGGMGASHAGGGLGETTPASGGGEAEARYRDVIKRLKRLLDTERRSLRQVRAAYTADLQARSELETLLRTAVDEVRREILKRRSAAESAMSAAPKGSTGTTLSASGSAVLRGGVSIFGNSDGKRPSSGGAPAGAVLDALDEATREAMGPEERKNVLMKLLRQEQVITRLMELVFPAQSPAT